MVANVKILMTSLFTVKIKFSACYLYMCQDMIFPLWKKLLYFAEVHLIMFTLSPAICMAPLCMSFIFSRALRVCEVPQK